MDSKDRVTRLIEFNKNILESNTNLFDSVAPKIFQLQIENISNVRNTIIISGALSTIAAMSLGSATGIEIHSFKISIVVFLLSIICYSLYLKNQINEGNSSLNNVIDKANDLSNETTDIVSNLMNRKISIENAEDEFTKIKTKIKFKSEETPKSKTSKLAVTANFSFLVAVFFLGVGYLGNDIIILVEKFLEIFFQ